MSNVLITGANRGIGLEFVRQYAAAGWEVIATTRAPDRAEELRSTGAELFPLEAAEPASIASLAGLLGERPIDILIANAGMSAPSPVDLESWTRTFAVNAIGPTLLAQALRANVARSGERKMIAITSQMGSIADNQSGGSIGYRSSKAALNAAWKSLAIDYRGDGITIGLLHPGWVLTDMGGPNAAIDVVTSVRGMRQVIAGLTLADSGAFLNYDGRALPW